MEVLKFNTLVNLFAFLFLLISPVSSVDFPSIYIPVGVGENQDGRNFTKPFGMFSELYNFCGDATGHLSEQFNGPSESHTIRITCEPHPNRIVVSTSGKNDFGVFKRTLLKECELFTCSADDFKASKAVLGPITNPGGNALAPNPVDPAVSVCKGKRPVYSNGASGSYLFANEEHCFKEHTSLLSSLQSSQTIQLASINRWIPKDQDVIELKMSFGSSQKNNQERRAAYIFQPPTSIGQLQYHECASACDIGQVIKYAMKEGQYRMMVHIKPTCPSFKVCFGPESFVDDSTVPKCLPDQTIDVLVSSGVVVWTKTGRASLIELRSPYHPDTSAVSVEFGYGVKRKGQMKSEFHVGNDHREVVTSDTKGFDAEAAKQLTFFFPNQDCLIENAGIFSKFIQSGKTLSSTKPKKKGSEYNDKGDPINGPQGENVTTPATVTRPADIVKTTTPGPQLLVPGSGAIEGSNTNSDASYVPGKWWTWGLFIGFVIGTVSTLILGSTIFYFLRRTVFSIWYRGMFKRYGCDVDASTAGITGVGFGAETTGTVTLANTTGGGTIGGDSVMGTTGGETTGTTGATSTGTEANLATESSSHSSLLKDSDNKETKTLGL